jgi:hypothetical protein
VSSSVCPLLRSGIKLANSNSVAFVEFTTPQAAAAVKAKIESQANQPTYLGKRHSVSYTNPNSNPFRTLPKEAPQRDRPRDFSAGRGTDRVGHVAGPTPPVSGGPVGVAAGPGMGMGMGGGAFRGRGGFGAGRGNMGGPPFMGNRGGFGGPVGPQGSPQPAFQTPMGPGFAGPNMPMQQFGGGNFQGNFQGRGGMMPNMRGGPAMRGRGGMGPSGMMGGGMGMGMGAGMGMGGGNMEGGGFNPMGGMGGFGMGGMGTKFRSLLFRWFSNVRSGPGGFPSPHFNPAFFPGGPQGGGGNQWGDNNPHPAKRPRPNE